MKWLPNARIWSRYTYNLWQVELLGVVEVLKNGIGVLVLACVSLVKQIDFGLILCSKQSISQLRSSYYVPQCSDCRQQCTLAGHLIKKSIADRLERFNYC